MARDYSTAPQYKHYEKMTDKHKEAYLYDKMENNKVQCRLCPRKCQIQEGGIGFCKVRKNMEGVLYALSYEKAVQLTTEYIETEACFHFSPGEKILSLGNFGCNLDCLYCQNWEFSQFQYTPPESIHTYSSDEVIARAKAQGIKVLSWTYNDPVVWYEFVIDTAKKAREAGLLNLFKSAMYISEEALAELSKYIDIFCVSIKAMDPEYYTKFTKGSLPPVLNAAKFIFEKHPEIHLEISNLVVTDLTNNIESYDKMINFLLTELSPKVPIHFTRFHPDYKYTDKERTPLEDVALARKRAIEKGIMHAYVGNAFEHEGLNTYCLKCQHLLVERIGLKSKIVGLKNRTQCASCGTEVFIKYID